MKITRNYISILSRKCVSVTIIKIKIIVITHKVNGDSGRKQSPIRMSGRTLPSEKLLEMQCEKIIFRDEKSEETLPTS